MLDTNVISDLIRNPQGKAAKRLARLGEENICTGIIVAAEIGGIRFAIPPYALAGSICGICEHRCAVVGP